jgi:multiple sugar transport system permease protein
MNASMAIGRRRGERIYQNLVGYLFIAPWLIGFAVFIAGAMIYSFGLSFFNSDMMNPPHFVGLANYQTSLFQDSLWLRALTNTAYYTFVSVPLQVILALLLAILLNARIAAQSVFRTIYYLPAVVSGVAVAILWIWLLNPDYGLINGFIGIFGLQGPAWLFSETWAMPSIILMSLWHIGGSMVIFLAGLQGVPQSLYEAARVDGANNVATFRHVTVPMITPTILFNLILGIIAAFQLFTEPFVMTGGGPNNATVTAVMHIYNRGFQQFHFGYASALAWILFAVILVFSLLVLRSSAAWVYYEGELRKE